MDYFNAKLIETIPHTSDCYELIFDVGDAELPELHPGNFFNIRVRTELYPFLMRPFSVFHWVPGKGQLHLLIKVIGEGTSILTSTAQGADFKMLGPLGNGFTLPEDMGSPIALLAGGIGIAPIHFWATYLRDKGYTKVTVFYGDKGKDNLINLKMLREMVDKLYICLEHCPTELSEEEGFIEGLPTELLDDYLDTLFGKPRFYCCGPEPMLKAVQAYATERDIPCELSCEENMACGLGACYGCAIQTKSGYKRVCKDGPVFNAKEVVFDEN